MSKKYWLLILLVVVSLGVVVYIVWPTPRVLAPVVNTNQNNTNTEVDKSNLIIVSQPVSNAVVSSPLEIKGRASGTWFFEGSFPIILTDDQDNILAQGIATSIQDWMTEDFIDFTGLLYFERPVSTSGKIIFKKDNPSGLEQFDDQLVVPVQFDSKNMTVKVYFTTNATGGDTDFDCNEVQAVDKTVPYSLATARAALEQLLKGPTSEEKAQGLSTSLNSNVKINSLTIDSGIARVDFNQQLEYQVGGSCRVASIRQQIEATLKQFTSVQQVIISIAGRTQDILQP